MAGSLSRIDRRARSVAVVFGLLTASAVLVYGWHGQIEAHFHYFVMIALLALYEDWLPFGLAITYVALEHGVGGALASRAVFSHRGSPWLWAGVHAGFVLAAAAAAVTTWRLNENTRTRMTEAHREARATEERFRVAFDSGVSGMSIEAPDGRFLEVNEALCAMLGYTEQDLLGRSFAELRHPENAGTTRRPRRMTGGPGTSARSATCGATARRSGSGTAYGRSATSRAAPSSSSPRPAT